MLPGTLQAQPCPQKNTCNLSSQEAEAEGSRHPDRPRLHDKPLSLKDKNKGPANIYRSRCFPKGFSEGSSMKAQSLLCRLHSSPLPRCP